MSDVVARIEQFYRDIVRLPIPSTPTMLTPAQVASATEHWREEIREFEEAKTLEDQIDAAWDLAWLAIGRVIEMGADAKGHFAEIARANGSRVSGRNPKRPLSTGFDAIKPEGWIGPDHSAVLEAHPSRQPAPDPRTEQDGFYTLHPDLRKHSPLPPSRQLTQRRPRVLVLGHARHGKDTVAEMLRDEHGYRFASSSMFCCEKVMLPYFEQFRDFPRHDLANNRVFRAYDSAEECYADRVNFRSTWFDKIEAYNTPDRARLAREMLEAGNDLYVGMRSAKEFAAARSLFDHVVWVDRPGTPPEPRSSFDIDFHPSMWVVRNGGTLEDLSRAVTRLANIIELGGKQS